MPGRLEGKVAIVTGAGSRGPGIGNGKATAILFTRAGAQVVLVDQVADRAEETQRLIKDEGGDSLVCAADVTQAAQAKRVVDTAVAHYGGVDILHNNIGISAPGS